MPSRIEKGAALVGVALFSAASVVAPPPSTAHACGGFFHPRVIQGPRRPSLSYERTLIIFDQAKHREHFVREVVFRAAAQPFGFVVPVPGRPEVASSKSPFDDLHREFPFEVRGPFAAARRGGGAPSRSPGAGVTVLEVKKVGSFSSFVLAADDEHALAGWLEKNGLTTTPESARWLSHYVRMRFYYVAMRYDPPPGAPSARESTKAETVRISFDTPLAYYPYYEPDPPAGRTPEGPRMLELWFASSSEVVPLAAHSVEGKLSWVRPMASGRQYSVGAPSRLKAGFGSSFELLPQGPVRIQRFIDQKRSRVGFGDILFVPASPTAIDAAAVRPLLQVLDPTLDVAEPDGGRAP
jgi:Uncharacterized protein conserved in bacteria (DUF2330)